MAHTSTLKTLVVVLNLNGKEDTVRCVESLKKQTAEPTILIIDNGSADNSVEYIRSHHSDTMLIEQPVNLGFAGGVNIGIRYAIEHDFDTVALFNNDAVADPRWLENLLRNISDTTPIVTGLLLTADGKTIDSASEQYSIWGMSFPNARNQPAAAAPHSMSVFGATGGATLYKTSLFKTIGLFDETFFAYFEDADINFRAQLAGFKAFYTKDAVAYHDKGATSRKIPGFTVYQMFKNLPLLFWKNIPAKLLLKVGYRFALLYTAMFAKAVATGSGLPALKGLLVSIYYFWTSAIWKRSVIQLDKKVSASYIWSLLYHDLPPEQIGMRKFRKLFTGKD